MKNESVMTDKIAEQIHAIRKSGKYNMFDDTSVQREANQLGYYELVIFIEENRAAYSKFILSGKRDGGEKE